jgi:hypothetical protein
LDYNENDSENTSDDSSITKKESKKLRWAKYETRRIVSEVKHFFTTVFSVFQNLEKPTWLSKKKKIFFLGEVFPLFGNLAKNGFFGLF